MLLRKSKIIPVMAVLALVSPLVSCWDWLPTFCGGPDSKPWVEIAFDAIPKKVGAVTVVTATLNASCNPLNIDSQTEELVAFVWVGELVPIPYLDSSGPGTRDGLEMIDPLENLPIGPLAKATMGASGQKFVSQFKFKPIRKGRVVMHINFGIQQKAQPGKIRPLDSGVYDWSNELYIDQ